MSINKNYIVATAMMASVALPLINVSHVDAATDMRTVTASSLNFRSGPSTSHSIIGSLKKGQQVEYISASGSWAKVKYNGVIGYVHADYLSKSTSTDNSTSQSTTQYVNAKEGLNVRSGAGTNYSKIGKLAYKEKVTVLSTANGWSKINYNGKTGYVSSTYLQSTVPGGSTNDNSSTTTTVKYVNAKEGLNVRSGAGTNYSKIGKLAYKEKVTVLSTANGWSKINYNGKTGYVSSTYLQSTVPGGSTNDNSSTTTTVKYVNAQEGLNVRSGAGTNYSKIGKLAYKEKVTVLSTANGWSKINYNGKAGYVSSTYLQSTVPGGSTSNSGSNNTVSASASAVIAYAKTLLGKPYVWGAQGPNSFDCSGFTYYVFKNKAGIILPRTSSAQSKYGKAVSKSNLRAGDLVFFDTNGANNGQVSHVGLYIGNGQMIHASYSQKKIVIDNFNSSYYQRTFVNARRVL